jgi:uncharacterized protein Usg
MVEKDEVSKNFRKQVLGYGLTTAEIVYRRPDRHWLLQSYVWQDYDMFPNFPALKGFLAFWEKSLDGPCRTGREPRGGRNAARRGRSSCASGHVVRSREGDLLSVPIRAAEPCWS